MFNDMGNNIRWVPGITIEQAEKECILQAFRFYRGNKTQTAQALRISIRTLEHKLEKYQSDEQDEQKKRDEQQIERDIISARMRGVPYTPATDIGPKNNGDSSEGRQATDGLHVQPPSQVKSELEMPLPKRGEIQKVLPSQNGQVRNAKRS